MWADFLPPEQDVSPASSLPLHLFQPPRALRAASPTSLTRSPCQVGPLHPPHAHDLLLPLSLPPLPLLQIQTPLSRAAAGRSLPAPVPCALIAPVHYPHRPRGPSPRLIADPSFLHCYYSRHPHISLPRSTITPLPRSPTKSPPPRFPLSYGSAAACKQRDCGAHCC
jgi:hypothetical protein